jgi:preprotein translocase subunit SecD
LQELKIFIKSNNHLEQFEEIFKSQLNVKKVSFHPAKESELEIELDTTTTQKLEEEGYARELSRKIQSQRKKAGLVKTDLINLEIVSDLKLDNQKEFIKQRTNALEISLKETETKFDITSEEKIKNHTLTIKQEKK